MTREIWDGVIRTAAYTDLYRASPSDIQMARARSAAWAPRWRMAGGSLAIDDCCPEELAGWGSHRYGAEGAIMGLALEVLVPPGWLA